MPPLPVELHPDAEAELDEAVGRYEVERRGVGLRFAAAVAVAFDRLAAAPDLGPWLAPGVRRLLVPGFPYGIVYASEPERLVVVVVAHSRRRPGYWRVPAVSARGSNDASQLSSMRGCSWLAFRLRRPVPCGAL